MAIEARRSNGRMPASVPEITEQLPQGEFKTPNEFTSFVVAHIAAIAFSSEAPENGTFARLGDKVKVEDNFNPFDETTWNQAPTEIREEKYRVILKPRMDYKATAISFLRQVGYVNRDISRSKNHASFDSRAESDNVEKQDALVIEKGITAFYEANTSLVDGMFVDAKPYTLASSK